VVWQERHRALEPVLLIVFRLDGVDTEAFGRSIIDMLGPKYWGMKEAHEQERFACARFIMKSLNPEKLAKKDEGYRRTLEDQRDIVLQWNNRWANADDAKIVILFLTHSAWGEGGLQYLPKSQKYPNGLSTLWDDVSKYDLYSLILSSTYVIPILLDRWDVPRR